MRICKLEIEVILKLMLILVLPGEMYSDQTVNISAVKSMNHFNTSPTQLITPPK